MPLFLKEVDIMVIKLLTCNDDKRKLKKTFTDRKVYDNANLKENTSVFEPIFIIRTTILKFNYVFCEDWGKYYFVTNITKTMGGLIEISCREDVLATYSNELKKRSGYVVRQEFQNSKYIIDNKKVTTTQRKTTHQTVGSIGNASGAYISLTVSGGV